MKKPVKIRRGRATVIDAGYWRRESDLPPDIRLIQGTRNPMKEFLAMATTVALFDDSFIPVRGTSSIPIEDIAPWAVFGTLIALIFLYFVSTEQGALALFDGMYVHEYVHDGRHLLGFPCH